MPEQDYAEQEINLRDYINVIIKRKKIILTVFFVSVITTAVFSLIMPKVYLSTATIQNGIVGELLIKKSVAEEIIKFYDFLNPIIKELKLETNVERLKRAIKVEVINDTDFLRFKVEYKDRDVSLKLCQSIVNSFLAQANNLYQQRLNLVNRHIEELNSQIKSIQSDIERTQGLIQNLAVSEKIGEPERGIRIVLLQNTLPNYQANLISLLNLKNDLQLTLIKAKEFKLIDQPIKPKYPIKPNKRQNVVISGVISLMFGVFLALFIEYWEKSKVLK